MASEIKYNSAELEEAQTILKESVRILESDLKPPISSSFNVLTDLDLFSEGLSKIKSQIDVLASDHNTFISTLGEHNSDINDFERTQTDQVNDYIGNSSGGGGGGYSGGHSSSADKVSTQEVDDGKSISDEELKDMVTDLSYKQKLQLLKSIMNNGDASLTSLLSNVGNSSVLSYLLKKVLNDSNPTISSLPSEYEKYVQEVLLEALSNGELNAFTLFNEPSFLVGMPYLSEVAKKNNMQVTDLVLNDNNSKILLGAIKSMYEGDPDTMLTTTEIKGVKTYIDNISKTNNIPVETLLSDEKYLSIVKGGKKTS